MNSQPSEKTVFLTREQPTQDLLVTRMTLLERAQSASDSPAWEELLVLYEPFINKVLGAMGFKGPDLDDVRQQVNIQLWKGLQRYKRKPEISKFRTWLSRLTRNAALNYIRSKKKDKNLVDMESSGIQHNLEAKDVSEQWIEDEWRRHVIRLALERMQNIFSGKGLEVFMRIMQGETPEQVSKDLGIHLHSVYVLKNRVRNRMRQEIQLIRQELEMPAES
ncbi:MAG: sigma-70 family RNA polymerase sigma factor [Verrucomicrobiota bacterium]